MVEKVLSFAVGDALLRVVEPVQMLQHCALVLQAAGQRDRAQMVFAQAAQWIETIAARNDDPEIRTAYRQNIPAYRALLLATEQAGHVTA